MNWTSTAISYVGAPVDVEGVISSSVNYVDLHSIGDGSNGTLIAVGKVEKSYSVQAGSSETDTKGVILRSTDGSSWTEIAEHTESLLDVTSLSDLLWAVSGENNALGYSTTDGEGWDIAEDAETNGSASHHIASIFYGGLKLD